MGVPIGCPNQMPRIMGLGRSVLDAQGIAEILVEGIQQVR